MTSGAIRHLVESYPEAMAPHLVRSTRDTEKRLVGFLCDELMRAMGHGGVSTSGRDAPWGRPCLDHPTMTADTAPRRRGDDRKQFFSVCYRPREATDLHHILAAILCSSSPTASA